MKVAVATLKSMSPYSQSRYHDTEKKEKESYKDYENRTWRERTHYNSEGDIFIPPMQFKKSLDFAASFLGEKIPGKGNSLYTKHFRAGILITEGLVLPIKKDEVEGQSLFMSPGGKSSSSVVRIFPLIPEWEGDVTYYILDEIITEDVFTRHLKESGNFIGLGRFRPERGGYYGRFEVLEVKWDVQV